jgi:sulfur carrier protein
MNIILNGEDKHLDQPITVSQLLTELGVAGKRVAVEVNLEIVPRSAHNDFKLNDADRVEVVQAIGGG